MKDLLFFYKQLEVILSLSSVQSTLPHLSSFDSKAFLDVRDT
jgi:hypothetical protein